MSTPAPPQRWRDTWMERSEGITDAWEVTKAYLGRFAEWALFACMVVNVIEILPEVNVWPLLVKTVLGTQVIMLDVGGFALMTMADHAKSQGREKAASKAELTAWALIAIMILTLVLVTTPVLFPDPQVKLLAQNVEKVLILIRIGMTILYSKVIHGLRSTATTLPVVVQDRLSEFFSQVEQRLAGVQQQFQAELQGVQQSLTLQIQTQSQAVLLEVQQHLTRQIQTQSQAVLLEVQQHLQAEVQQVQEAVHLHSQAVLSQVQVHLSEHLQGVQQEMQQFTHLDLQEVVQQVAHEAVQLQATQLVESMNEVRKEVRTTITQAHLTSRSTAQRTSTLTTASGTLSPSSHGSVPPAEVVSGTLVTQEDTGTGAALLERIPVERYIREQLTLNRIPSLNEIVQVCRCSKSTASAERQRLIPSASLERN